MTTQQTAVISAKRRRWVLAGAGMGSGNSEAGTRTDGGSLNGETEAGIERCAQTLAEELRLPAMVTRLLARRGLVDGASARAFLSPAFKTLHDPHLLPNMQTAVERLARAIHNGERILLFGDYDVDGITGTAMLWHMLQAAIRRDCQGRVRQTGGGTGADGKAEGEKTEQGDQVQVYIPHRVEEGYGMSREAIEKVIDAGAQLIVSIDCGVSSIEPVKAARERGIDVIVTDHHEFGAALPEAQAIVHPRMAGAAYPNPDLCGAGVAYKVCWALATHLCGGGKVNGPFKDLLIEFTALVGLATIADVVPLVGENRVLVKYGLQQLGRSRLPGLRALMQAAGYAGQKLDCTAVGFGLAPRLNAAGRMDHARQAVELLTTTDAARAQEIAVTLEERNRERQAVEKKMVEAARKQIDERQEERLPKVLVVHSEHHHPGVVGIVASRLVELYNRPAFVLACQEGECHGSARTTPGFDIHQAIEHCRGLLISGGGHAMAGGVKLKQENLEAFRACLNAYAEEVFKKEEPCAPAMEIDGALRLAEATLPTIECLMQFEPFGRGNPHPRFLLEGVKLTAPPRPVGSTGAHLQLQFVQEGTAARGIAFKAGPLMAFNEFYVGMALDLVVEPRIDHFNGRSKVDFIIVDMARSDGEPLHLTPPP